LRSWGKDGELLRTTLNPDEIPMMCCWISAGVFDNDFLRQTLTDIYLGSDRIGQLHLGIDSAVDSRFDRFNDFGI